MTNRSISVENLGPIQELSFSLDAPGVTVLVAPNGSGKTILLDAVQAAATGTGKLPLRDRTKRGKVEAFGATITIGGTCRHTGEFEVTNLEGRFDLAGLVDPRIKTPALADAARIKALVSLTGVSAAVDLFRTHEAFENFDRVVKAGSIATDDLVDMAKKIKADYDEAARAQEDESERETGRAAALIPSKDLDLKAESDAAKLQKAYDAARDVATRLKGQQEAAIKSQESADRAKKVLNELGDEELKQAREKQHSEMQHRTRLLKDNESAIEDLRRQVQALIATNNEHNSHIVTLGATISTIDRQLVLVNEAKNVLAESAITAPSGEELLVAASRIEEASAAVERGVLIRHAIKDTETAAGHRKSAKISRDRADKYRAAGKATDEVLSNCIKCAQLRVESDGKAARLVSDTDRGTSIPYHDLSDGEKWTIAIDIGADQVGEGGLLVISQVGWEGIDGKNRQIVHHRAVARNVYILTAEAASDPKARKVIEPLEFETAQAVQEAGRHPQSNTDVVAE